MEERPEKVFTNIEDIEIDMGNFVNNSESNILKKLVIPQKSIPKSIPDYNFPETEENLLDWEFVDNQMLNTKYYWILTSNKQNIPHTVPVWGLWYENRVFVGGNPKTKWVRNLTENPNISLHLPDAEIVCIIEGKAIILKDDDIDDNTWNILDSNYRDKYSEFHGSPYIFIEPKKVLAWNSATLDTMTIWNFG